MAPGTRACRSVALHAAGRWRPAFFRTLTSDGSLFCRRRRRPHDLSGRVDGDNACVARGRALFRFADVHPRAECLGAFLEVRVTGLMTIKDAAKLLALSDSMIRKLLRSRHLTPVRIGRSVRIRADDVQALIANGGQ